jgi:hypothetical protein
VAARSMQEPYSPARTLGSWVRIPLEACCVRLLSVCVALCVGSGLAKGLSLIQEVLPTATDCVYIKKLKKRPRSKGL